MDHVGNTTADMLSGDSAAGDNEVMRRFVESRPDDACFVIDQLLDGAAGLDVSAAQIGMSGHSFGGWTALKTVEIDDRIKALVPLAPGGGHSDMSGDADGTMEKSLTFNWSRPVPTLYLVGELDSILPLDGMQDLYNRNPDPKTMVVLRNADHFHFNDNIEQTHDGFKMIMAMSNAGADEEGEQAMNAMLEKMKPSADLCPGEHAYMLINGLGLAHFDAHLRRNEGASTLLESDLVALMGQKGINVQLLGQSL